MFLSNPPIRRQVSHMAKSIIVIGSGAAGMTAASTAKEKDPECNVTVFTEDVDIAYSPCAIPWGIEGKSAWTDIVMHTPDFYEKERGIKVYTKTKVESVDDAAKTVTAGGNTYSYDSLVIATGGRVFVPPIQGADLGNVFIVRTVRDGKSIQAALKDAQNVVIGGAGVIGLELAVSLKAMGKDEKNAIIKVQDTGMGLKEEKTDRLFDRFYQGNNSSDLHIEGTGIGLNLCKAFVEMHGGKIKAYNRTDGIKGSCFEVNIPLGKEHLKPEEILQEDGTKTAESTGKRTQANRNFNILIVDDDAEIAHYIKTELSDWYRFEHACNGKEGLKMLLTSKYDLVISDVMMPEMDGVTMLKKIKSNTNVSDIPVILLTSKSEVENRLEGLRKGADAFLAKPFNMEELHILIDNLVDNVRRIRGKYSGAQGQKAKIEQIQVKGNNDALIERVMKYMNEHLADPDLNVEKLTEDVGISRAQLHRKLKEIAGVSAGEFIRNLRLEQAARLIEEGQINITQVAYSVGFNNQTHFSTVFKKHYGMSPSEYAETKRNKK